MVLCSTTVPKVKAKGLPSGLKLTEPTIGTFIFSGTPATKDHGTYAVIITSAVKGQQTFTQPFSLTVDSAPAFKSKAKDTVHIGVAFSLPITTSGGYPTPTITTTSSLPAGVQLVDNGNGSAVLEGTPSGSAVVDTIVIMATNGIGPPVQRDFVLTVK